MITAIDPFARNRRIMTAERDQWFKYISKHIDQAIMIIVDKNNVGCFLCETFHYDKSDLVRYVMHLKGHLAQTVNYFIDNLLERRC